MFHDRSDYIEIVKNISKKLYPNLKPIFQINVWFVLKIQVSYQLHLSYAKGKIVNLSKSASHYIYNISFKEKYLKFNQLIFLIPKLLKYQFFTSYSKNQIVIAGYKSHNNESSKNDKNKYLAPFILKYQDEETLLYYFDSIEKQNVSFKYLQLLIKWHTLLYQLRINTNTKTKLLDYGVQINNLLETELNHTISGLDRFLANRIVEYLVYKTSYKRWLKKVKPTKIISYCFYDNKVNSLYSAANELNIKTAEYQHSAISERHFAYGKWKYIDAINNSFPVDFMVWNENDKKLIEANFNGLKYKPNIDVLGILHLAPLASIKSIDTTSILICLQGIWMPQWMEDFIRKDKLFRWYIRLHPRYPNDKEKLEELNVLNKSNLYIKEANELTLNELFNEVGVLITNFSGAAMEAYIYGINVIIYGEEGRESYKNYIEDGIFSYVDGLEELNKTFMNLSQI
jgi:hypothetical protein